MVAYWMQEIYGRGTLTFWDNFWHCNKHMNLWKLGYHPDLDDISILDDSEYQKFKTLVGMLVWLVTIARLCVSHITAPMSRFYAWQIEGHMKQALQVFQYLKEKIIRGVLLIHMALILEVVVVKLTNTWQRNWKMNTQTLHRILIPIYLTL